MSDASLDDQLKKAQIDKTLAEAHKLNREALAADRQVRGTAWSESLKILGAVVLGAGGAVAAWTQYEVAELKAKSAKQELQAVEKAKSDAEAATKQAFAMLKSAESKAASAKQDLDRVTMSRTVAEAATKEVVVKRDLAIVERKQVEQAVERLKGDLVQLKSKLQVSQELSIAVDDKLQRQVLEGLQPKAAELAIKLVKQAQEKGITVRLITGYRSIGYQEGLYALGRTKPGLIVTNAKRSVHNTGLAFDVGIIKNGVLVWEGTGPDYDSLGPIGKELGLVWGGDSSTFRDKPHFETQDAQQGLQKMLNSDDSR